MVADVVVSSIKSFPEATSLALVSDLQFNEPYSSAALNRKFRGIVNPGFYGGFLPSPAGGLNLKISSGEEGGTASINIDKYYQMTVRQQADVTMPVTAGKKVIVVLEATYVLGQETYQVNCKSAVQAAEIKFLEEGTALRQNQLELCTVTVPAGAPELTEEMIDVSRRLNKTVGITLSSEIDSDADHIAASSHAVKKAVKAARDETEKQIEELVDGAPASLDTLKKIANAINNDPDFFNTLTAILKLKAPLESPALTGIPTVPTPPLSVSNKQIANTEYVQAAVAALVGSSPEALDTLAELAEALGNDPNFATTMLNKLAGKQPLDNTLTNLSGKDVAGLIQYLGLVETVNRAAGSLQKDQNGADVPQPDWFVRNIGAARAFSGTVSIGGGGNWTTAEFIAWLESQGAFNHPYWMCKGLWAYADNRVITDTGCGNIQLAGAVVEVMGVRDAMTIRVTTPTSSTGGVVNAQFTYVNHGGGYPATWRRDFNTANKPTSEDVGALPITGGALRGPLRFLFQGARPDANCMIANDDTSGILSCAYGYYQDRFDIHFYDEKGAWASNPLTISRDGSTSIHGYLAVFGAIDTTEGIYDKGNRVYSPVNPPPAPNLSGYATQQWVLQNFVQNIDLTAPAEVGFWDGRGYPRGTDGAAMHNFNMVGGSSNVGNFIVRYTRKQVNNTWYVIN
ncbi:Uncharacterised protein [Citrobacter werkmanii]|uniref:HTH cro/C1-type domain-containing protein n=1 Tax=Citrobacter werkmanii TaxID=67827 RepID=A0A9N8D0J0_9ENTR|nr:hypothetical protein [Citrobacter werkmanii]CAB5548243.1 Uncharacterised protein [Citrobacter werkmanii]CAB5593058.1 Uncharacterised protein [Citrobacter werkmanii]CAB5599916.1 Uncharacterised protein [Citrobacter werkmanii]CAB5605931.1 Uncharacterised protein [Citrobacter werkmanii]CAB5608550.1 Uncharacterised protein [Citrobacter werkmanii]